MPYNRTNNTAKQVRLFFKNYFKRLYLLTGRNFDKPLQELYRVDEFNLTHSSNRPGFNYLSYELAINCIANSLKQMTGKYRQLFELRYIKELPAKEVNYSLGIAHTTHYDWLNKASVEFAEYFYQEQIKHGFKDENVMDLRA